MYKPLIVIVLAFAFFGFAFSAHAQPVSSSQRTLLPFLDDTYDLGSALKQWATLFAEEICLNSVCRTTWPSGGGGGSSSFGSDNEVPFTNATSDDFDYSSAFTFDGTKLTATNASTTRFNVGGDFLTDINGTGLSLSAAGVLSTTLGTAIDISDETNLAATYPLILTGDTLSTALATTSSNTWAGTQTFTNTISGNVSGTAAALAANGANCSAGNFPLGVDASGAVENCTDTWTEAENTAAAYAPQSRQLTVAGTANQITSSAGAQTLAADRTWTLSLPNHVIFPSSFQVTSASTTHATSTNLDVANLLTFNGVTGNSWDDFCLAIHSSADLCDGDDAAGTGGTGLATTSPVSGGNVLAYNATGAGSAYGVATSSLTINAPLTTSGTPGALVGGTNLTLDVDDIAAADLASADFGSFTCNGTTCTIDNSAVSNAMLANSTISGISLGSNLADLTATNSTLTFSGTYNGGTARSIGLNLGNANTWSAKQTFGDIEATNATSTGSLAIPAAASPNMAGQGRIAYDTTSGNVIVGTTTTNTHVVIEGATTTLYAFDLASTSPRLKSGGIQPFPTHFNAQVATAAICKVTSGTSVVVNLSDGTNDTNTITCTTTETQFALTSNNSFTARERIEMEVGTVTGSVDSLSIRFIGYRTSD